MSESDSKALNPVSNVAPSGLLKGQVYLPPEVLVIIAENCVEPYDAVLNMSRAAPSREAGTTYQIYPTPAQPVQKELQLSLVSKNFHIGIYRGLRGQFSGKLHMRNLPPYYISLNKVWKQVAADQLHPGWLIALVTTLKVTIPLAGSFAAFPVEAFKRLKLVELFYSAPVCAGNGVTVLAEHFKWIYNVLPEVLTRGDWEGESALGVQGMSDTVHCVCVYRVRSENCTYWIDMLPLPPKVLKMVEQ